MQHDDRGLRPGTSISENSASASSENEWINEITGSSETSATFSSGARAAALQLGQASVVRKANDLVRLRSTFGFELVEMRPKGAENPLLKEQAVELDKRSSNKRQRVNEILDSRKSSSTSAQAYFLRSILPASVRQVLSSSSQDNSSSLVDWSTNTGELGSMGLLYIILSLILLSGRRASEGTILH